eukprot:1152232-Pelagomonas_calceolata.AAC.3
MERGCLQDESSTSKRVHAIAPSSSNKRRIFFKYEKRIRDNSTMEKRFDYFSNVEQVRRSR